MFRSALPDLRETVEDQVAMLGIAPTGHHITVEVIVIQDSSEGKIVRVRGVLDALGLFQQTGAIPSAGHLD